MSGRLCYQTFRYGLSLPNPHLPQFVAPRPRKQDHSVWSGCCRICISFQGIDSFLKESWPLVRKAVPDAILRLVGSRLNAYDRDRWAAVPGVEVAGFLPFRTCATPIEIVLLWLFLFGPAVKKYQNIKVAEALTYGRTCVVSRLPASRLREHLARCQNLFTAMVGSLSTPRNSGCALH